MARCFLSLEDIFRCILVTRDEKVFNKEKGLDEDNLGTKVRLVLAHSYNKNGRGIWLRAS